MMPGVTNRVSDEAISIGEEKDEDDEEDVPLCNIIVHGGPEMSSPLEVATEALTEITVAEVAITTQHGLQKSMAAADEWSESSDSDNKSSPSTPRSIVIVSTPNANDMEVNSRPHISATTTRRTYGGLRTVH